MRAVTSASWCSAMNSWGFSLGLKRWASSAGLIGADTEPDATPFNDGVSNLLKYAFNMNAAGLDVSVLTTGGASGLPQITVDTSGVGNCATHHDLQFLRSGGSAIAVKSPKNMAFQVSCWCRLRCKPRPCGHYGCAKHQCRCSVRQIENYRQKISGPLLDRIDIHVEVPQVDFREITSDAITGESSALIQERVAAARDIQVKRFKTAKLTTNAAMGAKQVRESCKLDAEGRGYLEHAMEQMNFSARAHDRILKVARTLADLAGKQDITGNEVLEAIQFRSLDRRLFE